MLSLKVRTDDAASLVERIQAFALKSSVPEAKKLLEQFRKAHSDGTGSRVGSRNNSAEGNKGVPLIHKGKGCRNSKPKVGFPGKCTSTLLQQSPQVPSSRAPQLLVFISQSLPEDSVRELWIQAQKAGGKLVLRGLVGNSFPQTQAWIRRLAIVADIDPNRFEEFAIREVPTFILASGEKQDRMVGNVSLAEFLGQVSRDGIFREEARRLLRKIEGAA